MASEWREVQLSEVAAISSGKRPAIISKERTLDLAVPVVGGGGPAGFTDRALFEDGALVTGRVGTLGKLFAISGPCWPSDNALVVRPASSQVDASYLRYALEDVIDAAIGLNRGAANPLITQGDLGALIIQVPPIVHQRAIATVLGALDHKTEFNRRMSESLEGIARALFKSWFVDFNPVRAKVEGRDPGLPRHIADLFPDSFEQSAMGEIPSGWAVTSLGEVTERPQYGYTASASDDPVGPRFLRITDINKSPWIDWDAVPYCEADASDRSKYQLRRGDVVIARMADPGHGAYIEECPEAVFASYLIRFRPRDGRLGRFIQYWLRSDAYWDLVRGRGAGTTRATLNAKTLSRFPLVVPSGEVASEFARQVDSMRDRLVVSIAESGTLSQLRDDLLPRLISGDLRLVESAGAQVEVGT